jgi:hypothetical protein
MSRPWRVGGLVYLLAVSAFATYVYNVDFDLIRFLWLGTAPVGLTVPYISYLDSIPVILLGLGDPIDGNELVPFVIMLWTLAAAANVMIARLLWEALRSHCHRRTAARIAPSPG